MYKISKMCKTVLKYIKTIWKTFSHHSSAKSWFSIWGICGRFLFWMYRSTNLTQLCHYLFMCSRYPVYAIQLWSSILYIKVRSIYINFWLILIHWGRIHTTVELYMYDCLAGVHRGLLKYRKSPAGSYMANHWRWLVTRVHKPRLIWWKCFIYDRLEWLVSETQHLPYLHSPKSRGL